MSANHFTPPVCQQSGQVELAVANLEQLIQIWADLDASWADCRGIKTLIAADIKTLGRSITVTSSRVGSEVLERLISAYDEIDQLDTDPVILSETLVVCEQLCKHIVLRVVATRPPLVDVYSGRQRTGLQQLEYLIQWTGMKAMMRGIFGTENKAIMQLDEMIIHDLRDLNACSIPKDDATTRKVLEMSAKVRKQLPGCEVDPIDGIISYCMILEEGRTRATEESAASVEGYSNCTNTSSLNPSLASFDHQTQSRVLQKRIQDLETVVEAQKHERNVLMNDNLELKASKDAAIRDLEGRNADLAHELHNERESLANAMDTIHGHQALDLDEKEYREGSRYERSVLQKLEQLQEAEEDKAKLNRDIVELLGEKTATIDQISQMSSQISQLSVALKHTSDRFEEVEDENVVLGRAVVKFKAEEARFEEELTVAGRVLADSEDQKAAMKTIHESEISGLQGRLTKANAQIEQLMSSISAANMEALTVQNAQLEDELSRANGMLAQMRTLLNPRSTTSSTRKDPTQANSQCQLGAVESESNNHQDALRLLSRKLATHTGEKRRKQKRVEGPHPGHSPKSSSDACSVFTPATSSDENISPCNLDAPSEPNNNWPQYCITSKQNNANRSTRE